MRCKWPISSVGQSVVLINSRSAWYAKVNGSTPLWANVLTWNPPARAHDSWSSLHCDTARTPPTPQEQATCEVSGVRVRSPVSLLTVLGVRTHDAHREADLSSCCPRHQLRLLKRTPHTAAYTAASCLCCAGTILLPQLCYRGVLLLLRGVSLRDPRGRICAGKDGHSLRNRPEKPHSTLFLADCFSAASCRLSVALQASATLLHSFPCRAQSPDSTENPATLWPCPSARKHSAQHSPSTQAPSC